MKPALIAAIAAGFLATTVRPVAAAPIVTITPSVPVVAFGAPVNVEVAIGAEPGEADDVADLYAYQFGIAFDAAILSAQSVTEGPFLSSMDATIFFPGEIDNVAGLITFNANVIAGAAPGASGGGTLISILFNALAPGVSPLAVTLDPLNGDGFFDSSLNEIAPITLTAGSVTVEQATGSVPEPATALLVITALFGSRLRRRRHD